VLSKLQLYLDNRKPYIFIVAFITAIWLSIHTFVVTDVFTSSEAERGNFRVQEVHSNLRDINAKSRALNSQVATLRTRGLINEKSVSRIMHDSGLEFTVMLSLSESQIRTIHEVNETSSDNIARVAKVLVSDNKYQDPSETILVKGVDKNIYALNFFYFQQPSSLETVLIVSGKDISKSLSDNFAKLSKTKLETEGSYEFYDSNNGNKYKAEVVPSTVGEIMSTAILGSMIVFPFVLLGMYLYYVYRNKRKFIPKLIRYMGAYVTSKNTPTTDLNVARYTQEMKEIKSQVLQKIGDAEDLSVQLDLLLKKKGLTALFLNKSGGITTIHGALSDVVTSIFDPKIDTDFDYNDVLIAAGFEDSSGNSEEYHCYRDEIKYVARTEEFGGDGKVVFIEKEMPSSASDSAYYDELTSVYNRYRFTELVEDYLKQCSHLNDTYFALVDINSFKLINDSAGVEVGDLILMELASIIRESVSENDIIGRLSGDEFVVLFRGKNFYEIEGMLSTIYNRISTHKITHLETKLSVSVSIGLVEMDREKGIDSVTHALQYADYAAMTAKKNGFVFQKYDAEDNDIIFFKEAPLWINRIKSAIEHSHFELFVQEIKHIDNCDSVSHAEVLIRMKDGMGGYYSPFQFFGVAEKFNLMQDIDEWVISNVFQWIYESDDNFSLAINMSADSVKSDLFISKIIQYAKHYRVDPERVVFEVTETMAIDDMDLALKNINTLKAYGFKIALDDFGSGFSTLKYLQSIEADILKIDGIFIRNIKKSDRDRAIVEHVVNIAHDLKMKCIAEFVEDEETVTILKDCGVDYVQGFGIHKPSPSSTWVVKK